MSSHLSTLGQLFAEIQSRADEISSGETRGKRPLVTLLIMAFLDAMEEIRMGVEFEEFSDLAVLNLIIRGAEEGYSNEEIHEFVLSLQRDLA